MRIILAQATAVTILKGLVTLGCGVAGSDMFLECYLTSFVLELY